MYRIYLPHKILKFSSQKTENKIRKFPHYFQIEFLSSPKKMKNFIPSHLFLDIWLQKLSKWLINYFFVNPFIKSEISVYYERVHFSTTNEIIFTKQCSFHLEVYWRIDDFMHNILLEAVLLRSEAAVLRDSGNYVLLYDEKIL